MPRGAKVFCQARFCADTLGFSPTNSVRCVRCAGKAVLPYWSAKRCFASNHHSTVADSHRTGTRRGFLPRGLYDAHPWFVNRRPEHACAGGHPTNLNFCRPPLAIEKDPYHGALLDVFLGNANCAFEQCATVFLCISDVSFLATFGSQAPLAVERSERT